MNATAQDSHRTKVLEADTNVGTIRFDKGGRILTVVTPPRAKRQ
jgi:hypothetical protein